MSDAPTPPPPSVPAGWMDDPGDPTSLRYWDGSKWNDHRSPKPYAVAPAALALDGWVDVKFSTVPGVVVTSTKGNWYRVHASAYTGDIAVASADGTPVGSYARGMFTADFSMGFRTARKTPTWAIILGIIGLLVFFIGLLFFLVKEDRQEEARILTVTLNDGRSFSGPYTEGVSHS